MLIPFSIISYELGSWLFKGEVLITYDVELLNQIYDFTRRYLIGNIIVATSTAVIAYIAVYLSAPKILKKIKSIR